MFICSTLKLDLNWADKQEFRTIAAIMQEKIKSTKKGGRRKANNSELAQMIKKGE